MTADIFKLLADIGMSATMIIVYGRILANHEGRIRKLEKPRGLRNRRPHLAG